MSLNCAELK